MGQIGVFMTILEIVSPQNTKPSLFRNRIHDHTGQIFLPGDPKIFLLLSEISPRPKYSLKSPYEYSLAPRSHETYGLQK